MTFTNLFLSYFNEACIISSAIVFAFGWRSIRRRKVHLHRRLMLTGSVLAALFFITYVVKTIFVGDTMFGGPKSMKTFYYVFLQAHSVLATVAAVLGVITLVFAFRARFRKHRRIGPWTVTVWFVTAATGLTVFLLLYIMYTPGQTAGLMHAYLG